MRSCPLLDEATSRLRFHVASYYLAIEIELRVPWHSDVVFFREFGQELPRFGLPSPAAFYAN
jgi:hypothetical protein